MGLAVIASILLTATTAMSAAPSTTLDAATLMDRAARAVDLRARDGAPFRLSATFWVQEPGIGKLEGRYELSWRSPEAWREEITYPGHNQLSGQDERGSWILTELPRRTLRLFDIANALDVVAFAQLPRGGKVGAIETPKRKLSVVHIQLALSGRFPWSELSLDRDSGLPVRHETGPATSPQLEYKAIHEFSGYRPWRERRFPGLIKRFDGRRQVLELRVEGIADLPDEFSALLARPEDAVDAPVCTAQERLATVSCDSSRQPFVAIEPQRRRTIGARAVVARDGRLHDIVLVESSDFVTDGRYRDYLELWRCVPLTCGGVPADSEVFEFRIVN